MPFSQRLVFDDAAGALTLASGGGVLAGFAAGIGGFQPGDTIKLAGLDPAGIMLTYGNGVLTARPRAAPCCRRHLTFQAASFTNGTAFVVASDGSGGSVITTTVAAADWNGVTNAATTDWSAANWTGGTGAGGLPGAAQTAMIANNTAELAAFKDYVLTVSSAETAGSVVLDDHFADLVVTATLTLQQGAEGRAPAASSWTPRAASRSRSGGDLVTRQLDDFANLTVDTGGTLAVSGVAPAAPAIEVSPASTSRRNAAIARQYRHPAGPGRSAASSSARTPAGNVSENGGSVTRELHPARCRPAARARDNSTSPARAPPGQDVGDAANTADTGIYRGDMVVGGGGFDPDGTVPIGGLGELTIDIEATVDEAGAAMLGVTGSDPSLPNTAPSSFGSALVQNGATWNIGTFLDVGGSYLYAGAGMFGGGGSLQVMFGGLVQLGTAETAGQYKATLGTTPGSSGQVIVSGEAVVAGPGPSGTSSLDTGGGAISIGEAAGADGSLDVSSGGTVTAGSATPGIAWGAVIGDAGASGTLAAADGDLTVGSGGGASLFSVAGGLVDGNAGQGFVFVDTGGSLAVAGTLAVGEAAGSSGTFTVGDGGTATAGAAAAGTSLGVVIGDAGASGTLAAAAGTLTVGTGTGSGGARPGRHRRPGGRRRRPGVAFVTTGATVTGVGQHAVRRRRHRRRRRQRRHGRDRRPR